jgi:hypothetical protein
MAYKLWNGIPLINDETPIDDLFNVKDEKGNLFGRGYVERDFNAYPHEMFAPPSTMPLIDPSEYDARIEEQERTQSSLEHIYLGGEGGKPRFVNLNQNGQGYCWSYSTGHTMMIARLRDNQPLVRLNPHASACIIKGGRDEGGWCGLSAQWSRQHGYAEEGTGEGQWPLHGMSLRYDTPALRANMSKHKVAEDWVDMAQPVYGQNLTQQQIATCLLSNQPCAVDYSWWGHSVCELRLVKVEAGSYGRLILNSWLNWGRYGLAVIQGSRLNTMGAICSRVVKAA